MIKVKYGLFEKEIERQHKLRQFFQELHQVFNARIFRDKAILKAGIKAADQIATMEMLLRLMSEEKVCQFYIAEKGSLSSWFFNLFRKDRAVFLRPCLIDYCSTRYLFSEVLEQIYPVGVLNKSEIFDIYVDVHKNTFGDTYYYEIKDLEPKSNFLGFKKYNWSPSC